MIFWLRLEQSCGQDFSVMRVTLEIVLQDQLHFSIVSWSVEATMTTNSRVFSKHGFWVLQSSPAGSDGVIALHPDGVQRHHCEWRVSPLDDPESNLRELKEALALVMECDWRTPWLQNVSGCAVSQRLALCGMQRDSSPCNGA